MLIATSEGIFNGPEVEFSTLEDAQADRLHHIDLLAFTLRERMVAGTHPAEMSSWALKLAEAQRGGGTLLATEAAARGIEQAALVAKVLANAQALAGAEALIAGAAGRHRDAIAALGTIEEVASYDFSTGWSTF